MNDKYYKAGDDTYTFIDTLEVYIEQISQSGVILEVGCGNGEISNFLRIHCKHSLIISSDINIDALVHTKKMARTECVKSSLLRCFNQKYIDTVIFNPPYVETENDEIGYSDIRASYSGGIAGRVVIKEFVDSLTDVRNVYLLVIKKNDPDYIIQKFVEKGYSAQFVKIRKILAETLYIIKAVKK